MLRRATCKIFLRFYLAACLNYFFYYFFILIRYQTVESKVGQVTKAVTDAPM